MNKARSNTRGRGFVAVLAAILLSTSAASVITAGRTAGEGARISRLAVETTRARLAAQGGKALALSASRGGLSSGEIVVDPVLGVMTFEETTENNSTTWVVRAMSGDAMVERTLTE